MSTPIYVESVAGINDIIIRYVNHLLQQHANDQYMLANQDPSRVERMREIRAKNTDLEIENRSWRAEVDSLRAELKASKEENAKLLNQLSDYRTTLAEEREKRVMTFTTRKPMSNADGEAAIVAGREALEAHKRLSEQPGRGE